MRAIIYARYSTDGQRDASVDEQIAACKKLAAERGWTVVAAFDDRAISGASAANRPGLASMLARVEAGGVDVLLVWSLDRLSRSLADTASIYDRLKFAGVSLWSATEGEQSGLLVGIRAVVAQEELRKIGTNTRRGLEGRARRTFGGRALLRLQAAPDR